ncbi:hypothetical protein TTHERM_00753400 (macronuclear) [Tetrahymena thermophila SB210]|uniref:Uncharacterized protein n=1 Tax=Tetrahymena thermophila (strain SB210) TaxID=312017 RepID=Q23NI0_TETTS|nr:hypothetical protein TTHERM_00753400 [Tetrahymena thermophila SB210]EAR98094.2 hypothetical protein TTHERM_00753400 [Tetrahymena thermophila SB210]|eukprot:XP_001018339.2 hypothetical protein TTHERM_00753400 [Tetrahymena thermophila SB210]
MDDQTVKQKKNRKVIQKRNLKKIKYGQMLIQELESTKLFQIAGDITLDINQLLNKDHITLFSSWNDFIKVKEVKKIKQPHLIEVILDTDVQIRSNLKIPVKILKNSQQIDLLELANLIEEYQKIVKAKQFIEKKNCQNIQEIKIKIEEDLNELDCDEQHGWSFEQSTIKAERVINELNNSMKDSDDYYSYILFKGNKYDQTKCRIGYSTHILKDFLCLNDEQIESLSLRKPIIFNLKYNYQYTSYLLNRIHNLNRLLKQEKSDLDNYRKGLNFLNEVTFNLYSIDNFVVEVKFKHYLYVLSNYKNKMDDVLWVGKCMPVRDQSASQVLKGMRNLKQCFSQEQKQQTMLNPQVNKNIFCDSNYEKQSKILINKFYPQFNNDILFDIQEYL